MTRIITGVALAALAVSAASCASRAGTRLATPTPPTPPATSGWPMLGHDLGSSFTNGAESGITPENAASLREIWSTREPGSVTGTPAVSGGVVYVLGSSGTFAFDAATGAERWRNTGVRGTSSPTLDGGRLYVNDARSVLHALNAADGTEVWQSTIDTNPRASGFSSPVVAGGLVIVGSASVEEVVAKDNATFRGSLVAFDITTGVERWRRYTAEPPDTGVSIWSTPSVDVEAGLVFASTGNNYTGEAGATSDSIFAVRLADGAVAWQRQLSRGDVFTIPSPRSPDSDFGTNPILFRAKVDGVERDLLGAGQKSGMFWVLDRKTGEVVWSRKVSGGSALIGGVFNNGAWDGARIILAGNNGQSVGPGSEPSNGNSVPLGGADTTTSVLEALDPATGAVVWERQLPAWVWAPITVAGGVGFVAADRRMEAFDTATGRRLWILETGGTIAGGAAVADGRAYVGSGLAYLGTRPDGAFHALAPQ